VNCVSQDEEICNPFGVKAHQFILISRMGMVCCAVLKKLTIADLSPDPIRQGVTSIFVQRVKNTVANEDLSGSIFEIYGGERIRHWILTSQCM